MKGIKAVQKVPSVIEITSDSGELLLQFKVNSALGFNEVFIETEKTLRVRTRKGLSVKPLGMCKLDIHQR